MSQAHLTIIQAALVLAGVLHFVLLLASLSVPRVLRWDEELAKVHPFTRQVVLVHGAFIVLLIIGFGVITLLGSAELLQGSTLGVTVAGFIGLFWLGRLLVQLFYYRPGSLLAPFRRRLGYGALTVLFVYFTVVYLAAAVVSLNGLWVGA